MLSDLAMVLDMARSHIEDIESGLADGTYEKSENLDIDAKNASADRIQAMHDKLAGFESQSKAVQTQLPKDFVEHVFRDRPRA